MEEENSPTQSNEQTIIDTSPQEKPKSHKLIYSLLIIILLMLLGMSLAFTYVLLENQKQRIVIRTLEESNISLEMELILEEEADPQSEIVSEKQYIKRRFVAGEFIMGDEPIPIELSSIKDDELVGVNCGDFYYYDNTDDFYYAVGTNFEALNDPLLVEFLEKNEDGKDTISTIMKCETDEGPSFVVYSYELGLRGSQSTFHFGYIDENGQIGPVSRFENNIFESYGAEYLDCHRYLGLTTSDVLYFECFGGDEDTSTRTIIRLNLSDESDGDPIVACRGIHDIEQQGGNGQTPVEFSNITCEDYITE